MVPRMRTVSSAADAGVAMQIKAKLTVARARCTMPDIVVSPIFGNVLPATPQIRIYSGRKRVKSPAGCTAPQPEAWLFDFDPGVLDHLAPALFLAAHIPIKLLRGTRDHDEALIQPQPFECFGLNGQCRRFVEAVDDIGWRPGRREQAVPALSGVAGNASLDDGRQLRKGRRALLPTVAEAGVPGYAAESWYG